MKDFYVGRIDERCAPLWQSSFGDSKEWINDAVSLLSDSALYAAIIDGGEIMTQCLLIEHRLCGRRGLYIYAACTDERFRGRGHFTYLLEKCTEHAEKEGFDLLSLIPASETLKYFYKRRGFVLPCKLSASPVPSRPCDFYSSIGTNEYTASGFDGDFRSIYELSDKRIPFGAFIYAYKTVEDICEIVYTNDRCGYVIRHREDKSKIFDASSNFKIHANAKDNPEQASLLIKKLRGVELGTDDFNADPLPR